jgi:diaminohydroxyphosphoribosylaminopyrimidine deaminase/5-amino-6-(5-phosphoribosylamino)uracil reductase
VTTGSAAGRAEPRRALEARGAEVLTVPDGRIASALRQLGEREIAALLLEGGAGIHAAAWDEGVVDFVRLYVSPHLLGEGVRCCRTGLSRPRRFSIAVSPR